jgi:hypothetical protein
MMAPNVATSRGVRRQAAGAKGEKVDAAPLGHFYRFFDPDEMTLGPGKSAAVPLAPAGPLLAVAEGIETPLSFMQTTGIPTLAACSAGGIRRLILPAEVSEMVIAGDTWRRVSFGFLAAETTRFIDDWPRWGRRRVN